MDRSSFGASPGLMAADPSLVFLIKSLLYPVVAAANLAGCLWYWREPFSGPYFLLEVLAFFCTACVLDVARLDQRMQSSLVRRFLEICLRWLMVVAFVWAVIYSAELDDRLRRPVLLSWAALTPLWLLIGQIGARAMLVRVAPQHIAPRRAVVVGLTDLGARLAEKLREDPFLRIDFLGFFDERSSMRLSEHRGERLLGMPSTLPEYIASHGVNLVYITLPMMRHPRILDLLDLLRDSTVSIYFVPDMFVFDLIQARFDRINGIPVLAVCESPFYGIRGIAKRASDVLLASSILLLIWPLLLIIGVGVKLSSPGPALFKQRRYGLDGKEIVVYKFRTMTVCEDGGTIEQARVNDRRITPYGGFLRRTSLDELPQFLNVLQGRMSIVGPRPHAVAHNEQYRKIINGYMIRHKVRPGITGLAQVNGFRGETANPDSMATRIRYDLEYLRTWSMALDLSIIFRTVTVLLGDRNAY